MYKEYLEKGLSLIPDKFASKMPAIKGWSDYCDRLPTASEWESWEKSFDKMNYSLCMGKASNVVALDLDCVDNTILDKIVHLLPSSPVEKRGSKGYTRFFKYSGQSSEILKYNGNVVLEILSTGKKTTIPPSTHPNGEAYVWTSNITLLDIDSSELPLLPPMLISVLQHKLSGSLPESSSTYGKVVNGRNSALSTMLSKLIAVPHSVDLVVMSLVREDKATNEIPYFTDANEFKHTDAVTNALSFYISHVSSFNAKRYREGKEYVSPFMDRSVKPRVSEGPEKQSEKRDKGQQRALTVNPLLVSIMKGQERNK